MYFLLLVFCTLLIIVPEVRSNPLPQKESWYKHEQDDGYSDLDLSSSLTGDESFGFANQNYKNSLIDVRKKKSLEVDPDSGLVHRVGDLVGRGDSDQANRLIGESKRNSEQDLAQFYAANFRNIPDNTLLDDTRNIQKAFYGVNLPLSKDEYRDPDGSYRQDPGNENLETPYKQYYPSYEGDIGRTNERDVRPYDFSENGQELLLNTWLQKRNEERPAEVQNSDFPQALKSIDALDVKNNEAEINSEGMDQKSAHDYNREPDVNVRDLDLKNIDNGAKLKSNPQSDSEETVYIDELDPNESKGSVIEPLKVDDDYHDVSDHRYIYKREEPIFYSSEFEGTQPSDKLNYEEVHNTNTGSKKETADLKSKEAEKFNLNEIPSQLDSPYLNNIKSNIIRSNNEKVSKDLVNKMNELQGIEFQNSDLQSKAIKDTMRESQAALAQAKAFEEKMSEMCTKSQSNEEMNDAQGLDQKKTKRDSCVERTKREDEDEDKNMKNGSDEGEGEYEEDENKNEAIFEEEKRQNNKLVPLDNQVDSKRNIKESEGSAPKKTRDTFKKKNDKLSTSDDDDEDETELDDNSQDISLQNAPVENVADSGTHLGAKKDREVERKGAKVWDQWGKWSQCSTTCGVGKMTRWRHCISGGCAKGEKEAQIKTCTNPAC